MKKITIINMSSHRGGNGEHIADFIQKQLNHEVEVIHFSELEIHGCGRCAYDCFTENGMCPYQDDGITSSYRKIANSDFCYFILPNYGGGPCANYFMFRERSQSIWRMDKQTLWTKYASVPKHFLVISNTERNLFEILLKNEIKEDAPFNIDYICSSTMKFKAFKDIVMEHSYYQNQIRTILENDGLL